MEREEPTTDIPLSSTRSLAEVYQQDGLYGYFGVVGFLPSIVALLGGKAVISLLGIAFNLDLVWVTYTNKSLHGICNVLIALCALSNAVYEVSFLIPFGVVASGRNVIPFMQCVYLQLIPAFAKYFSLCLLVFIGLDRLKSVLLPTWQHSKAHYAYNLAGVTACAAYCCFLVGLSVKVDLDLPSTWSNGHTRVALCSSSEISRSYAGKLVSMTALVLNAASVCIYLLIVVLLQVSKTARNLDATDRIYRSLCVIVLFEVVGWGSNSVYQQLTQWHWVDRWGGDEFSIWWFEQSMNYLQVIATAVNAPVLCVFSTDAILTLAELILLFIHLSVFACICRQIVAGSAIYTSAFFKIYLLRCVADYITYFTGTLSIRLMIARLLPPPSDAVEAVMAYAIMFGVFVQLFLYAGVVANRYTAIAHPGRHRHIWTGRSFAAILCLLLLIAAATALPFEMGIEEDGKIPLMAAATFAVTAGVCLSSVFFEVKTVLAYRRMNKAVKRQMKEEFLLLGYAVFGLVMPIGLSISFGIRLFCSECYWSMVAFPYLLDYMSLCEPVWLLLASRSLRNVYLRVYGCRAGKNQSNTTVVFTATATH